MASRTLPAIILGSHTLGDVTKDPGLVHFDQPEEVEKLLTAWAGRGYNQIDTARNYPTNDNGGSEGVGKEDYTEAKTWHPISLQSTLGKVLETVIAETVSHSVEAYGLLPTNHFGAREQRWAEQALLLLQEQVYNAWRGRRMLTLMSFDVKGAGVFKDRILQKK